MFNDQDGDEQDPERLQNPNQNQLAGIQPRASIDPRAYETGQLIGMGRTNDSRVQADPTNAGSANGCGVGYVRPPQYGDRPGSTNAGQPASTRPSATAAPGATAAGSPVPPAAGPAAQGVAGQAASGGAMPWVGAIAGQLAQRAQEQHMRRQAQAGLAAQYAGSQGNFPMYGYQGQRANQNINDRLGGPGLNLGRLFHRR